MFVGFDDDDAPSSAGACTKKPPPVVAVGAGEACSSGVGGVAPSSTRASGDDVEGAVVSAGDDAGAGVLVVSENVSTGDDVGLSVPSVVGGGVRSALVVAVAAGAEERAWGVAVGD